MKQSGTETSSKSPPGESPGLSPEASIRIWLVKSGDRILGPFSTMELTDRLRAKDIVLIDEVITPRTRWRVVRDEPVFRMVVEEIRKVQLASREDTEIQGHTTTGISQVATDPHIRHELEAVLQPPPLPASVPVTEITHTNVTAVSGIVDVSAAEQADLLPARTEEIQDAEFTEAAETKTGPIPTPGSWRGTPEVKGASVSVRQYGITGTPVRRKTSLPRVLWLGAAGVVLVAGLQIWRMNSTEDSAPRSQDYEHIVSEAERAWREGEFASSMGLYKRADQARPQQPDIVAHLATLMVRLESQTAQAKRLVTDTIAANVGIDAKTKAGLFTALGLCALASDDLPDAEQQFQHANEASGGQWPVGHFNAGVSAFKRKDFDEAAKRFAAAGNDAAARLMVARSIISLGRSAPQPRATSSSFQNVTIAMKETLSVPLKLSPGARAQAEEAVDKVIVTSQDFSQEAHLLKAVLLLGRGDTKNAATEVRRVLDIDPELTRDHRHEPYEDLDLLAWRELTRDCEALNEALQSSASRALLGLCLFSGGDHEKSSQVLGDALGAAPEDPYLQSVNAYMLAASERYEDAQAALRLVPAAATPVLADLTHARICAQNGDATCAAALYTSLAERQPPVLAAYAALADINVRAGDRNKARAWIEKAKALSPSYRPVLQFYPSVSAK